MITSGGPKEKEELVVGTPRQRNKVWKEYDQNVSGSSEEERFVNDLYIVKGKRCQMMMRFICTGENAI